MKLAELFNEPEDDMIFEGFGSDLQLLEEAIKGPFDVCPQGLSRKEFRAWVKERVEFHAN
jgi:hypothetical protein